ncbi:MAG: hypothetical protein AAGC63_12140 [Propionicimonas sp.]|nr:hypothetical protein [Propionicimonas sp.]
MAAFWQVVSPWLFALAGLGTLSLLQALVAPHAVLGRFFGEDADTPGVLAVVRHWGASVAACGALLLAAAFLPDLRTVAAAFAVATKAAFVALVLGPGRAAARPPARLAAGFDLAVVLLLAGYLAGTAVR